MAKRVWVITSVVLLAAVAYFMWPKSSHSPAPLATVKEEPHVKDTKPSADPVVAAAEVKDFNVDFPDPSKRSAVPIGEKKAEDEPADDLVHNFDENGRETTLSVRDLQRARDLIESKNGLDINVEFSALNPIRFDNEEMGMLAGRFAEEKTGSEFEISYTDGYTLSPVACVSTPETGTQFQHDKKMQVKSDSHGYAMILLNGKWMFRVAYAFKGAQRVLIGRLYEARGEGWNFSRDIEAYEIAEKAELAKCHWVPH